MKKTKSNISSELTLTSLRFNLLKAEKRHIINTKNNIDRVLGRNYSKRSAISSLNQLLIEIDFEINKRKNRIRKLMTTIIKRSGKTFQESPKILIPGTKDIIRGYIELHEIKDDTLIPHVLIISLAEIIPKDMYEKNIQYQQNFLSEYEFDRLKSHLLLVSELDYYQKAKKLKVLKDEDNDTIAILEDFKVSKLTDNET